MDEYNLSIDAIDEAFEDSYDKDFNTTYNSVHDRRDVGVHSQIDWLDTDIEDLDS